MKITSSPQIYKIIVDEKEYLYHIISGEISEINQSETFTINRMHCEEPFDSRQLTQWKEEKGAAVEKEIEFHNLALVLSQDCNMRCVYCYENGGSFNRNRKIMDMHSIKKTIDWWEAILPKNLAQVTIEFYGGEPLLNVNGFDFAVSYLNQLLSKRQVRPKYSIITNGTVINQTILNIIVQNKMAVMVSVDGNREAHNRNRKLLTNIDSYDIVIQNIHTLIKEGVKVTARITLTKDNIRGLYGSVLTLWNEGVRVIDCIPVLTDQEGLRIKREDLPELEANYVKIENEIVLKLLAGEKYYFNNFMRIIYALYLKIDKYYPTCGYYSAKKIYCTPDGEVYNCEKLIGREEDKIGDIGYIRNSILKDRILEHTYSSECSKCLMRRICGGQCYADAINHGEYMNILCQIQKMQFESAFKIYIRMIQYDERFWDTFFERG